MLRGRVLKLRGKLRKLVLPSMVSSQLALIICREGVGELRIVYARGDPCSEASRKPVLPLLPCFHVDMISTHVPYFRSSIGTEKEPIPNVGCAVDDKSLQISTIRTPELALLYSLMTLKSGLYIINNLRRPVGRSLAEDHSLNPKTIFADTDSHHPRVKYNTTHNADDRAEDDIFYSGASSISVATNTSFLLPGTLPVSIGASSPRS